MECNTKAKTSAGWNVLQNVRENLAFFFCAAVAGNGALSPVCGEGDNSRPRGIKPPPSKKYSTLKSA